MFFNILFEVISTIMCVGIFAVIIILVITNIKTKSDNTDNTNYTDNSNNYTSNNYTSSNYTTNDNYYTEVSYSQVNRPTQHSTEFYRPSMKDRRDYGAVKRDQYGNLYDIAGGVIDKTAIELKKQTEMMKRIEESRKREERYALVSKNIIGERRSKLN